MPETPTRVFLCGVPVDVIARRDAVDRCRDFLRRNALCRISTVNPEFIVEASRNVEFRDALMRSDIALADGTGIVLAARLLRGRRVPRIPGVDFMQDVCALARDEVRSTYFIGGRGGAAERAAKAMELRYPGLRVAGWSEDETQLPAVRADVLFVALGAPAQECWIAKNAEALDALGIRIAMGVGGSFDLISERIRRAPRAFRAMGLEWFWRLLREPWRAGRIFRAVAVFPFLVVLCEAVRYFNVRGRQGS